jgi:hypothetical protein
MMYNVNICNIIEYIDNNMQQHYVFCFLRVLCCKTSNLFVSNLHYNAKFKVSFLNLIDRKKMAHIIPQGNILYYIIIYTKQSRKEHTHM